VDYAIILAGGKGTRFWPLSRKATPKQFLRILGKDTFFEATLRRAKQIIPLKNIFIITNQAYLKEIKEQSRQFGISCENIILEPTSLNTLPAISLCTKIISLKDNYANLLVFPSDHYIKDPLKFKQAMLKALRLSLEGFICLIGIKPHTPHSGYGYIKAGKIITKDAFHIHSFIEKPAPLIAKSLFRRKGIFWNAGIFCFQAKTLFQELSKNCPALYRQISRIEKAKDIKNIWKKIKPVSIDYGLLEHSRKLAMVEALVYWRDLGSWEALCEVLSKDKYGNAIVPDCEHLGSSNIFVYKHKASRLIATIGLKDTIIIDTPDALLVAKKKNADQIKHLVGILEQKRRKCV